MNRLPIGIQTFSRIIEDNQIYIDKTPEALHLIQSYKYAFLSRPRRFGKSLFADTLQEIFEGNKGLFEGLYIHNKYDFEPYPVIKIDWSGDFKTIESTIKTANFILERNQKRLGIQCATNDAPAICFAKLIQEAYVKYQKPVVVLVDEYDKPILDNLDNTQRALENRDFLRSFYVQLKANDRYLKFAFLTGISKFSKANIFSGLNNLEDISLMPDFGNICGYTQNNIEQEFREYSKGCDLKKIKSWYNGYYFLKDRIYNPFDILQLFKNRTFKNYWWKSGNPYFLITLLKQREYYIPNLVNIKLSDELLDTFEVSNLRLEVLLYQSGYLTIDRFDSYEEYGLTEYTLTVPNREVQTSLNALFYEALTTNDIYPQEKIRLLKSLKEAQLETFKDALVALFASIPYHNFTNNTLQHYEGYYASVVYAYLASLGTKMIAEDVTNKGRIDLTLLMDNRVYIIEFKVGKGDALGQIKEKGYHQKYLDGEREVYLVGITFDETERNIGGFVWEKIVGSG